MDFIGKGQPLSRAGLNKILDQLGLDPGDEAYVWTVVEVETAGFGFQSDRRPWILFERHKFKEFTGSRFDAETPDISGPRGNYGPSAIQYTRLEKALALCEGAGLGVEPALKAASWGIGQVMGFNHAVAGFPSAGTMVEAMKTGEDAQLSAMAGFLAANHLAEALKNENWDVFAERYNGKNYRDNDYHNKLRKHYEHFSSGSLPSVELRAAQAALFYLGYAPGKIDGVIGPRTRAALRSFRADESLPAGDDLDRETYTRLCQRANIDPEGM